MTLLILIALLFGALVALSAGCLCRWVPVAAHLGLVLARLLAALAVAACGFELALHGTDARLPLPLGPPGFDATLLFDPLAAVLLLTFAVGLLVAAGRAEPSHAARLLAVLGFGTLLACAGDAWSFALAAFAVLLAAGAGYGRALFAGVATAGALALLAPAGGLLQGDAFFSIRLAHDGVRSAAATFLALSVFLAFVWRSEAAAGAGPRAAARLMPLLGGYVLLRIALDLGAGAILPGLGAALGAGGLAIMLAGGLGAVAAATLQGVLDGLDLAGLGLVPVAVGVALAARGDDLALAGSDALGAGLLLLAARALAAPLAAMLAASIEAEAGTRRLAAMGGLSSGMPRTTLLMLAPLATMALLPPSAGYASLWLLVSTLLEGPRAGGLVLPVAGAIAVGAIGLAVGLAASALLRLVAVALLGRPRTPRGAASSEIPFAALRVAVAAIVPLALLALLPGPFLRLAAPALRELATNDPGAGAGPLGVSTLAAGSVFSPVAVLALLALGPLLVRLARGGAGATMLPREVDAWRDGAAPPPDWLPFGEPLAQPQPASFARPVLAALGLPTPDAARGPLAARLWRLAVGRADRIVVRRLGLPPLPGRLTRPAPEAGADGPYPGAASAGRAASLLLPATVALAIACLLLGLLDGSG